jgi:hypothetical protein
MKVLAVKGVEKDGKLWTVRYNRLNKGNVRQDAHFTYDTQEEATAKYHELLDILQHHNGVYVSKWAKKKLKTSRKPARQPFFYHYILRPH